MARSGSRGWCITFLVALSVLGGCFNGGDDDKQTCESLTAEGWATFEAGNFSSAESDFHAAISLSADCVEARNGVGWCQLRQGWLEQAIEWFDLALSLGLSTADPHAGKAIACRDVGRDRKDDDYAEAIASAQAALEIAPRYVFGHDDTIDWRDLRLILAQCYFHEGEYELANAEVDSLDEGNPQDQASETFVEDLLGEIQRLGTVLSSP